MTDPVDGGACIQEENLRECRACLKKLDDKMSSCNVFQPWAPHWNGMEDTIAEDLAKLANIEISEDGHTKFICAPCYNILLRAAKFVAIVRNSDLILQQRVTFEIKVENISPYEIKEENVPPIQEDTKYNILTNTVDIQIKKEVVSDEENTSVISPSVFNASVPGNTCVKIELPYSEIKIEPEEIIKLSPVNHTIFVVKRNLNTSPQRLHQGNLETNNDQDTSNSMLIERVRVDTKNAERNRLYRERHKEEINKRRRDIRNRKKKTHKVHINNISEIEQTTDATSNNQHSSNSDTKEQRYYVKNKEEKKKRRRDSTVAERNRSYRERNRQKINERRRYTRQLQRTSQQLPTECDLHSKDTIKQITEETQNNQQINSSNVSIKQEIEQNSTSLQQHNAEHFEETHNDRVQTAAFQKIEE